MSPVQIARLREPEAQKKRRAKLLPAFYARLHCRNSLILLSGTGSRGLRLAVCLRNANVAADGVLADLIDHELFGDLGTAQVEEDGLVNRAILLFKTAILRGHGHTELTPLLVCILELDGQVADLLR